jgi:hypothetical protein
LFYFFFLSSLAGEFFSLNSPLHFLFDHAKQLTLAMASKMNEKYYTAAVLGSREGRRLFMQVHICHFINHVVCW